MENDWTDRKTDGMKDGRMHTQTDEGHFYSPPSPMSGVFVVVVTLLFYIHGNHLRDHVGTVS